MKKMIIAILVTAIVIALIVCPIMADHQVEVYTVGAEVSGIHYVGKYHDRPRMRVRTDDFATVLAITNKQAARYVKGDIVVIEVEVREGWGGQYEYYRLVD